MEAVMTDNMDSFNVRYDRASDVLYISTPNAPASRGIEDAYGLVWRYDRDGVLIGVTIVDFYEHWWSHRSQLAHEVSKRFGIPERQAEVVFNHVIDNLRRD
jgi:uncharacterized protein YuzE